MQSRQKIIIGMSGGVDSSVAALLLLQQGYNVEGLFMKNWEEDDDEQYCAAAEDLRDASAVCETLGIRLHTVNFSSEYWDRVFQLFLDEYSAGRTPNPDILCNKEIKFRAFLEHALTLGADKIATGHYARVDNPDENNTRHVRLLRGLDSNKDQSYFLYTLNQYQLSHALFPIGEYDKQHIRQLAKENNLVTHNKKDSTGICFIGERRFNTFLEKFLPAKPGIIKSVEGEELGSHNGLMYYTLGQRKGLGIGGVKNSDEEPWYVVEKDLLNNILLVAQGHNHPHMFNNTLEVRQLHWVAGEAPDFKTMTAKIRYRQADQASMLSKLGDDHYQVTFDQPQRAITPGQSVVFYNDEECLGGGIIETMYNS
ncbi:MAG TPA: tRNA 2-thiouridine(34) synthase MnmA [Thiotrichales bacterium]|nr:tRNA 2-thiouridine(34) synthase MnmA [Thiotrichales bacterium]